MSGDVKMSATEQQAVGQEAAGQRSRPEDSVGEWIVEQLRELSERLGAVGVIEDNVHVGVTELLPDYALYNFERPDGRSLRCIRLDVDPETDGLVAVVGNRLIVHPVIADRPPVVLVVPSTERLKYTIDRVAGVVRVEHPDMFQDFLVDVNDGAVAQVGPARTEERRRQREWEG